MSDRGSSNSTPFKLSSTISVTEEKHKPKCGLVQKPGYSCEEQTSHSSVPKLFVEVSTWTPKEDLEKTTTVGPPDTVLVVISHMKEREETMFDSKLSSAVTPQIPTASQKSSVNRKEESHIPAKRTTPIVPRSFLISLLAENVRVKNKKPQSQTMHKITPSHGLDFRSIATRNTNVTDGARRGVAAQQATLRKTSQRPVFNTTKSRSAVTKSNTQSRREGTLRSGINNHEKFQMLNRILHTLSTYPPFPRGITPSVTTEATTAVYCGVAKCLKMEWTSIERAVDIQKKPEEPPPEEQADFLTDPLDVVIDV